MKNQIPQACFVTKLQTSRYLDSLLEGPLASVIMHSEQETIKEDSCPKVDYRSTPPFL